VNVGTKELKNRLSHYLRLVRAGESVTVCDRGKAVAELRGASAERVTTKTRSFESSRNKA